MITKHGVIQQVKDTMGIDVPYLYQVEYSDIDWEEAKEWFKISNSSQMDSDKDGRSCIGGGFVCSCARKGNLCGRNYDFTYNEASDFVVKTKRSANRYSSVGISSCNAEWTPERIRKGLRVDEMAILPFALVDGINEKGVYCNANVVPAKDFYSLGDGKYDEDAWNSRRIDINSGNAEAQELYYQFMVRFVLDNAKSAKDAVEKLYKQHIVNYVNDARADYDGIEHGGDELHFMIADSTETYILEIINDKDTGEIRLKHISVSEETSQLPIMTNYYQTLEGFDTSKNSPNARGIERANLLRKNYFRVTDDIEIMREYISLVKYTNIYSEDQALEDWWFSELLGYKLPYEKQVAIEYLNSNPDKRIEIENYREMEREYIKNERKDILDQPPCMTLHTGVFDIENKKMHVWVREDYNRKIEPYSPNGQEDK